MRVNAYNRTTAVCPCQWDVWEPGGQRWYVRHESSLLTAHRVLKDGSWSGGMSEDEIMVDITPEIWSGDPLADEDMVRVLESVSAPGGRTSFHLC